MAGDTGFELTLDLQQGHRLVVDFPQSVRRGLDVDVVVEPAIRGVAA